MAKEVTKTKKETSKKPSKKPEFYQAVGRRKTANARVRLYPVVSREISVGDKIIKKDEILVNGRSINQYFPGEISKKIYNKPFEVTNTSGRFAVSVLVEGSGLQGQLDAVVHGISRALVVIDKDTYKPLLKKQGLITRDPRMRERRKAGLAGKARAGKQSPKR